MRSRTRRDPYDLRQSRLRRNITTNGTGCSCAADSVWCLEGFLLGSTQGARIHWKFCGGRRGCTCVVGMSISPVQILQSDLEVAWLCDLDRGKMLRCRTRAPQVALLPMPRHASSRGPSCSHRTGGLVDVRRDWFRRHRLGARCSYFARRGSHREPHRSASRVTHHRDNVVNTRSGQWRVTVECEISSTYTSATCLTSPCLPSLEGMRMASDWNANRFTHFDTCE